MPRPLPPEPLDCFVSVRLTAGEKARLREDAELAGLSVSELIRRRYFGRAIVASSDAATIRELRRLGGLLKHIHNESRGAYSAQTAAALVAVTDQIGRLASDRQEDQEP